VVVGRQVQTVSAAVVTAVSDVANVGAVDAITVACNVTSVGVVVDKTVMEDEVLR